MKINRVIINLLIIIFLAIIQIAFLSKFNYLNYFNLILSSIILISININDFRLSLFWAVIGGFFMDLYSFLPFGTFILTLILLVFIINLLVKNFLPSTSLLSVVALGIIGISFYNLFLLLITKLFYFFKIIDFNFILNKNNFVAIGWSLLFNLILILVLFWARKSIKKYERPFYYPSR